jgi:hypothetical protein
MRQNAGKMLDQKIEQHSYKMRHIYIASVNLPQFSYPVEHSTLDL